LEGKSDAELCVVLDGHPSQEEKTGDQVDELNRWLSDGEAEERRPPFFESVVHETN
jgi:hypothetical protein